MRRHIWFNLIAIILLTQISTAQEISPYIKGVFDIKEGLMELGAEYNLSTNSTSKTYFRLPLSDTKKNQVQIDRNTSNWRIVEEINFVKNYKQVNCDPESRLTFSLQGEYGYSKFTYYPSGNSSTENNTWNSSYSCEFKLRWFFCNNNLCRDLKEYKNKCDILESLISTQQKISDTELIRIEEVLYCDPLNIDIALRDKVKEIINRVRNTEISSSLKDSIKKEIIKIKNTMPQKKCPQYSSELRLRYSYDWNSSKEVGVLTPPNLSGITTVSNMVIDKPYAIPTFSPAFVIQYYPGVGYFSYAPVVYYDFFGENNINNPFNNVERFKFEFWVFYYPKFDGSPNFKVGFSPFVSIRTKGHDSLNKTEYGGLITIKYDTNMLHFF